MEFKPAVHQVAGHKGSLIAKGLFAKPSTDQESKFYCDLIEFDSKKEGIISEFLSNYLPLYYGTLLQNQLTGNNELNLNDLNLNDLNLNEIKSIDNFKQPNGLIPTDKKYILLNNLYEDYINPSIIDLKLGKKLTDSSATLEKRQRLEMVSNSTTSGSLYFRVCGMKLYNNNNNNNIGKHNGGKTDSFSLPSIFEEQKNQTIKVEGDYVKFDKFFGRSLTDETIKDALKLFIEYSIQDETIRLHYIEQFYKRLQLLYNCLIDYEIRIISGSLLLIIENNPIILEKIKHDPGSFDPLIIDKFDELEKDDDDDDDDIEEDKEINLDKKIIKKLSSLHLIDFAHAKFVRGKGPDDNILEGIENLIRIFESLL